MTALGPFTIFPVMMLAFVLGVIVVALCRMKRVRTAIWMRSSGFFLEANSDLPEKTSAKNQGP